MLLSFVKKCKNFIREKFSVKKCRLNTGGGAGVVAAAAATVGVPQFKGVLDEITKQINVANVVLVLTAAVGAGVGFAFMWWGVRKLIKVLMSAFKRGRVSV